MASTYSQYKIELVGTGEQAGTWGTTTNNNFGSATPGTYQGFEQAIGGRADVTMSGTTTLSLTNSNAAQDARALYLNLSGTLSGAADLVVPALQKSYLVKNGTTGGFAVTIKVTGQTGVSIPNGKTVWVYNNGTDIVTAVDFIPEIATTTVDATNIEVTNIKAKDGTSAGSIADSTGVVTLASSVLTTTDINGGTIDGAVIGGASAAAGSFTTLNTSGQVVFNDAGADVDFRVEGDTDANLLFVDASADAVGIGTSTPTSKLEVYTGTGAFNAVQAQFNASNTPIVFACNNSNGDAYLGHNTVQVSGTDGQTYAITNAAAKLRMNGGNFQFNIAPSGTAGDPITFTQAMTLDASGRLLVGATAAGTFGGNTAEFRGANIATLGANTTGNLTLFTTDSQAANRGAVLSLGGVYDGSTPYAFGAIAARKSNSTSGNAEGYLQFYTTNSGNSIVERMRIDSSGNVGIGTTSPAQSLDTTGKIRVRDGGNTTTPSIQMGASGVDGLSLPATNNIAFITNSSEAMRIDSSGNLLIGKTSSSFSVAGTSFEPDGDAVFTRAGNRVIQVNRLTDDGDLVHFYQDSTLEGTISVSGTTVSYNGGNLSRWAQTLSAKDESLKKGTVLSNLDEMNVYVKPTLYWTEDDELPVDEEGNPTVVVGDLKQETSVSDNEQLNKVKVSDVEGDPNVAGVFVNWTYDEAHQVDEINMAMTGDMIIRIAEGVTVARGDLLMSAGDGTAKPQGDDIVRSKTIAKVTSTHVTCTYEDGSYCVPCVLMAC
jgi:hypothetical protein